jgi:hypothetical protein
MLPQRSGASRHQAKRAARVVFSGNADLNGVADFGANAKFFEFDAKAVPQRAFRP